MVTIITLFLLGALLIIATVHYIVKRKLFRGLASTITGHIHNKTRSSKIFLALLSSIIGELQSVYKNLEMSRSLYTSNAEHIGTERKCPKGLPQLDPVEHVSKNVWRILGMNPGSITLQGTNTWLVGNGESKVLIDTGEGFSAEKYVKFLLETVFPLTKTKNISTILLTHGHGDHLGGVTTLLKELKKLGQPSPKVYKRQVLNGKYPSVGFVCEHISDGQCFNASENSNSERIDIKSVYSAGHTDDHVAFTLQEESFSSLFSGDCVLGCGTAVFDDLFEYMSSLEGLRKLMVSREGREAREVVTVIYPGHGPVIKERSLEKIDEYISHRQVRENEIYSVLQEAFLMQKFDEQNKTHEKRMKEKDKNNSSIMDLAYQYFEDPNSDYCTSWGVMSKVYGPLPIVVKFAAQKNCLHHLEKMRREKKVDFLEPDFWKLSDSDR